jgi:hypothetical protein
MTSSDFVRPILAVLVSLSISLVGLAPFLLAQEITTIISEEILTQEVPVDESSMVEQQPSEKLGTDDPSSAEENPIIEDGEINIKSTVSDTPVEPPVQKSVSEDTIAKRVWSDDEILELGYVPDEVVVKFKKDRVNLKTQTGKRKAGEFIGRNSKKSSTG